MRSNEVAYLACVLYRRAELRVPEGLHLDPELIITPGQAEYEQLIEDLETLRGAGAHSNTQAIVEAVREKAKAAARVPATNQRGA